jgi:aconitate hydratase
MTLHMPSGERLSIFHAAMRYKAGNVPLIIIAGEEYGFGSARDWAAKGPRMLGVRAVIAKSFERIHRSNLVGMGILPCQFESICDVTTLALNGSETFDIVGLDDRAVPLQALTLVIHRANGVSETVKLKLRVDTDHEMEYLRCGGILHYVLGKVVNNARQSDRNN